MALTTHHIDEIVSDSQIRGGKPVIRGTGIRVMDIVLTHTTGDRLSAEQIAADFKLELGQVYAALAYYYLHQAEIDAQIHADQIEADRLLAELETQGKLRRIE